MILLLLSGVSISLVFDDNGIIKKTQESRSKANEMMQKDLEQIKVLENGLNTKTGTGDVELAFKIEGKKYKIEQNMTWAQWIGSVYNTDRYRIEGDSTNGVVLRDDSIDTIKYCPKATKIAVAKDKIMVGKNYTLSTIKLPIYWYLSKAGEYVGVTSENDLVTALDSNNAQLVHCELDVYETVAKYRILHSYHGSAPEIGGTILPQVQLLEGALKSDESLISTNHIAIPYYEYGEDIQEANSENPTMTIQELLNEMDIDTSEEITTNLGTVIDINEYEEITPFFEIYLTNSQNDRKYTINGSETVKLTAEVIAGMSVDEIILLCIEANSNDVVFIEPEDLDPDEKTLIAELSNLGAFKILVKKPYEE